MSKTDSAVKGGSNASRESFYAEVNRLHQAQTDRLNADPNRLFGAVHHEFSASMLGYYFDRGLTPEQTLREINQG